MPTEFLHGLYDGGAGAGLEDYWKIMTRSRFLGGGFIWALVDEGFRQPATGVIDLAGNRAADGILGPYRQKEASFYTIKEILVSHHCPAGGRARHAMHLRNRESLQLHQHGGLPVHRSTAEVRAAG